MLLIIIKEKEVLCQKCSTLILFYMYNLKFDVLYFDVFGLTTFEMEVSSRNFCLTLDNICPMTAADPCLNK